MKRGIVLFFLASLLFISIYSVYAEDKLLWVNESFTLEGKTITVKEGGGGGNHIVVDVDGVEDALFFGDEKNVNGMFIKVNMIEYFSKYETRANLTLTVYTVCGDYICDADEDSTICCKDCNCTAHYYCGNKNICVLNESELINLTDECEIDEDCDDNNKCTTDSCGERNQVMICLHEHIYGCGKSSGDIIENQTENITDEQPKEELNFNPNFGEGIETLGIKKESNEFEYLFVLFGMIGLFFGIIVYFLIPAQ